MEATSGGSSRRTATRFADVRATASTGSTNTDVLELGRAGAAEGIVVVADVQTAGRGRRGRTWQAAPGDALLLSVLLRPPAAVAGLVTAALALAALDAVAELGVTPDRVGMKWPNDLIAVGPGPEAPEVRCGPDRKLAGVLAEAEWPARANVSAGWREPGPSERALVAAGIGVNLHWPVPGTAPTDEAVDEVADRAVSLDELCGRRVERDALLAALLEALEARYGSLTTEGRGPLLRSWRERCVTLGRSVRIDLGADDVEGTAVDISDDGHLVVDTVEGGRRTLAVGDVVHLR